MKRFRFEIQGLITDVVEAETVEEARSMVIYNLEHGEYDECLSHDATVSDGEEIK